MIGVVYILWSSKQLKNLFRGQCIKCGGYREVPMDENGKAE